MLRVMCYQCDFGMGSFQTESLDAFSSSQCCPWPY